MPGTFLGSLFSIITALKTHLLYRLIYQTNFKNRGTRFATLSVLSEYRPK